MCEFKYIVVSVRVREQVADRIEIPVMFPIMLTHIDMFESVKNYLNDEKFLDICCVSAGTINLLSLQCFGKSSSLLLNSRGSIDSELIRLYKFTNGYTE